jgi:hypothetical protein
MKKWILITMAVVGAGVLAGVVMKMNGTRGDTPANPQRVSASNQGSEQTPSVATAVAFHKRPGSILARASGGSKNSPNWRQPPPATATAASTALLGQAIDTLVSPQSNFGQRQAVLEQLSKSGKLDQAISELEQRMAGDPRTAEYPAALGRAYLQKCSTIQDMREQGILAMKADQVFDAALNLDSNNWDARFTKAVAMSYWPTQMNKGNEIIGHFSTLIDQQEAQVPQAYFAQTYLWMGDAYQKYGQTDSALQVWQRGAALFPQDPQLRAKLQAR